MDAKRVVIIDDEMVLGQLLQAAFATLSGHIEVKVVPNAEEAAREVGKKEIHLVVSDVKLPGMSGLEFTAQTKKKVPQIKIILVSGLNDPQLAEKAAAAGADAFFPKPVEMRDFLDTSSRLLGLVTQTPTMSIRQVVDLRTDLFGEVLIGLRQDLAAFAVLLVDERGKILASAGDPTDDTLNDKVIPYLLSAANSIQRINAALQTDTPENVISIKGSQYDLVVSPVPGYLLMVFLKHAKTNVRLAVAFDAITNALFELQQKISEIDQDYPLTTHPEVEQAISKTGPLTLPEPIQVIDNRETEDAEVTSKDFDNLFSTVVKKKVKNEDADSFWDKATEKPSFSDSKEPGLLSFDEANQLGLTPREDNTPPA